MAALRLPIEGTDHLEFVPAAGVPWFLALFGRDSLIVSLQNAMVHPGFARGALEVLSRYQAKRRDDYRDAEPGKIMHELRRGELAHFKLIPHTPYYGTADATILYLIVLHNAWRCTGDPDLLVAIYASRGEMPDLDRQIRRPGRRWLPGVPDPIQSWRLQPGLEGFRSRRWSIPTGRSSKRRSRSWRFRATSTMPGCAWLRSIDALGKSARAQTLREKAEALFIRFNDAFWDEESGFYAFCLDGDKKQVLSVASNPGQCLWSGIVPPDRAAKVVKRLMKPDMWSGWGIRTLSADNPSYNPNSYQNGAVWPHDNGIIALGFRRYGFVEEAARIARDISGAASYFMCHQMPELYSGMQRDPTNFPVQYLGANVPQAWAAGSCFAMLQMIVGFQPDAPAGKLYIDPALPVWLPELTIRDLQVGKNVFDLRFLARRRRYAIRDPEGRSGRRRPEELRHGRRAMAVARYQKPAN